MRPENQSLLAVLNEGRIEAVSRQMNDSNEPGFEGRMAVRLQWAIDRIRELESQAAQDSWQGDVDRQGGALTVEEIERSRRGGEGW